MPATRFGTRQGSHQPQYQPNNGGPSHANPITLIDDDGPPRKKQLVERKSSKQRAKQKARAPLPPAAEIIEISSDEDQPPRKRSSASMSAIERKLKELEEENKQLKAAAASAVTSLSPPLPPLVDRAGVLAPFPDNKFLSTIEEHVSCEVCTLKMWFPYTLACGHTFCKDCLQDWFNTAYVQHLSTHPHYDAQQLIPARWRASLALPDLPPQSRAQIEREIAVILSTTPQPQYSCPTCRVLIKAKPAENFVVKHLVRTIAGIQGESCPKDPPIARIPGRLMDGPFDGFFPYPR